MHLCGPETEKYGEKYDFFYISDTLEIKHIETIFQVIDMNGFDNDILWYKFKPNPYSSIFWQTYFISKQPEASITHAYLLDKSRFSFKDKRAMAREVFLI